MCSSLYDAGQPVCLEVAVRVKKYLQSIEQNSKTDKLDAQGICRMACERKLKLWQPFSPNILSIRAVSRHRKSLIESQNRIRNKLHAMTKSACNDKEIIDSLKRNINFLATW